ncbi:TPA: hypothetical protein SL281_004652 [Pseudomonas aeruginosa]|nr:hypothetical protein [Pseudomonas aeruginosa]
MATHALLLESGTVLFFDVVTDYSVQQQTQTTEHTLETGAVTSDHIIQQARQIQLNAILSDADFNYDRPTDTAIRQASAETGQDLSRTQVQDPLNRINAKETQPLVTVSDSGLSIVSGLLGDAGVPSVTVPDQGKTTPAREVAERLSEIERAGQTVTLLTFRLDESGAALPDKTYTDMLITNLTFNEDQDSGDGVFFSMGLQQLRYFSPREITIRTNKGRQPAKRTERPSIKNDAANGPQVQTNSAASDVLKPKKPDPNSDEYWLES